jgi:hypothetical protein
MAVTEELSETLAAGWRRRLEGHGEGDDGLTRAHWRTKVSYYQAMQDYLDDPRQPALTWQEIVDRVRPRGKGARATFYMVAGSSAKHPLLREYEMSARGYAQQLAVPYRSQSAVQKLLDETKSWGYWPYRSGYLTELRRAADVSRRTAAECLIRVVAEWAATSPRTAAHLECLPPSAAVEDLVVILGRRAVAADAHRLLRDVIDHARGPLGATPDSVLLTVRGELDAALPASARPADPVDTLAEAAFEVTRRISALPGVKRAAQLQAAAVVLADTLADLRELRCPG